VYRATLSSSNHSDLIEACHENKNIRLSRSIATQLLMQERLNILQVIIRAKVKEEIERVAKKYGKLKEPWLFVSK
jgi:hypothetical protein